MRTFLALVSTNFVKDLSKVIVNLCHAAWVLKIVYKKFVSLIMAKTKIWRNRYSDKTG